HGSRPSGLDPSHSRIPGKKTCNACFYITFLSLEPLNSLPYLNSGIVIVDRKFSRANPVLHVGADNLTMHRALLISAFLSRRLTALGSELPAPLTRLRLRA